MLPKRTSLVAETLQVIRKMILEGAYGDRLPSERALSVQLQVGRNTVRLAVKELEETGWVSRGETGRRRQILEHPDRRLDGRGPLRRVFLLFGHGYKGLSAKVLQITDQLRKTLAASGVELQVLAAPSFGPEGGEARLADLVAEQAEGVWLLARCSERIQTWFAHAAIPALALGYADEFTIPGVAADLEAVAHHLRGRFATLNHRRVALLQWGEELIAHQRFTRALREGADAPGMLTLRHDGDRMSICRRVDRALRGKTAVTALVMFTLQETLTVLTHLQRSGVRVPEDVSLVVLGDDPLMVHLQPMPSHYALLNDVLVKRVYAKLFKVWEQGGGSVSSSRMMCEFVKGETLAAAPSPS